MYLAIVVLVTITLYYQLYVQFSVSTPNIRDFDFSPQLGRASAMGF